MPEPETSPGLPAHTSLGYEINHLARLLAHGLRERIEGLGVVPGQFAQLLALYEKNGLTQAELCELVEIEQPTMANTLARMQRDGLITREPDPADRRRSRVLLTYRAHALKPELVAAAREVNALATAGLSPHEVEAFFGTVAALIANLEKARTDAPPTPKTRSVHD